MISEYMKADQLPCMGILGKSCTSIKTNIQRFQHFRMMQDSFLPWQEMLMKVTCQGSWQLLWRDYGMIRVLPSVWDDPENTSWTIQQNSMSLVNLHLLFKLKDLVIL
jgi:hypothetical protein